MTNESEQFQGIMSNLSSQLLSRQTLQGTLEEISKLARDTVQGADQVSVTVWETKPYTIAYTGETALEVDIEQYKSGEGPCLDAIRKNEVFNVADMRHENRWPMFTEKANLVGFRASHSVPISPEEEPLGAMNIYANSENAFSPQSQEAASRLASAVGVTLANLVAYEKASALVEQLQEAMQSRSVIDQAKGILMATRRCTADEAFESLRLASQHSNRKLRDIALEVTQRFTGEQQQ